MNLEDKIREAIERGPATGAQIAIKIRAREASVVTVMSRMWCRRQLVVVEILPPPARARMGRRLYAKVGTPSRLPDHLAMAPECYHPPIRPYGRARDQIKVPKSRGSGVIAPKPIKLGLMGWGSFGNWA